MAGSVANFFWKFFVWDNSLEMGDVRSQARLIEGMLQPEMAGLFKSLNVLAAYLVWNIPSGND